MEYFRCKVESSKSEQDLLYYTTPCRLNFLPGAVHENFQGPGFKPWPSL
jgi:hypothetical protein